MEKFSLAGSGEQSFTPSICVPCLSSILHGERYEEIAGIIHALICLLLGQTKSYRTISKEIIDLRILQLDRTFEII